MAPRETFSSRNAAIIVMAGSAIGLGNIWRFPYMAGENGGAAFIIIYLVSTLLLSLPIFLSESVIGRRSQLGAFGAFGKLAPGTMWKHLSLLTIATALIILSFYSVVGGWSVDYLVFSAVKGFNEVSLTDEANSFPTFISSTWMPLVCHTIFLGLTALIVRFGIKSGIEKFSKITLPLLFVLIVFIIVFSLTLPGSSKGVEYLLKPDFSKITASTVAAAMGQSFFSLSLGVGTILTYSSHIGKNENLLVSGLGTAASDVFFAILAGFAVMPAVFACGLEPGAGPGLIFESIPMVFAKMSSVSPVMSYIVAILFFITVLVAALTSSISMLETGVAYLTEQKGMRRGTSIVLLFAATWLLGCLCSLSFGPLAGFKLFGNGIFDLCDKLTSNFLMAFGGLLFTVFVGWKMSKSDVREELTSFGRDKGARSMFGVLYFLIKYVAPIGILAIFVSNLLL